MPGGGPGIQVIAGAGQTDTVNATFAQALVVEVHDKTSRIASGVTVRFRGIVVQPANLPAVFVSPVAEQGFSDTTSDVTDAQGRAKTLVHLGISIGTARLEVSVPQLGLVDTVSYTVKPGSPFSLGVSPTDTSIAPGSSYQLRIVMKDAFGHPLTDVTPTFSATGVTVSPAGQVTAPNAIARGQIAVTVGKLRYNVGVTVMTKLPMVITRNRSVVLINADGTGATTLATSTKMWPSLGPSSVPATPTVVFHEDDPYTYGRLWVVQPGGTPSLLLSETTTRVGWARLSPDGTWVYFVRAWSSLWRVRLDGTGLDSLAAFSALGGTNPTPSIAPDGKSVAVAEQAGIRIIDVATKNSSVVPVTCGEARHSPDGAYFACLDAMGLSVVRSDGTGQRHVADLFDANPDMSSAIDWSVDGKWVLVSTVYRGAVLVEVSSGTVAPLTALGASLSEVRDASFVH